MALNIDLFYSFTLCERIDIINRSGEYITSINHSGYYISLYLVQGIYVEVYSCVVTHLIEDVETVDQNNEKLHLFSQAVDLADLYRVEY